MVRAGGRFLGAWMLNRLSWSAVLAICSGAILACFAMSIAGGVAWGVYTLPLSGLFMSVIYPTINSKGISSVPKSEHGAAAGVLLFFTCLSAVLAPLFNGSNQRCDGRPHLRIHARDRLRRTCFLSGLSSTVFSIRLVKSFTRGSERLQSRITRKGAVSPHHGGC
jgi:fucose permease